MASWIVFFFIYSLLKDKNSFSIYNDFHLKHENKSIFNTVFRVTSNLFRYDFSKFM